MSAEPRTRLKSCSIKGFKSIRGPITITFPENVPLVLIGPNNAGKSNIVSALDLILGEQWPTTREPQDHDCWGRDATRANIEISVEIQDQSQASNQPVSGLCWRYDPQGDEPVYFRAYVSGAERYVSKEMRNRLILVKIGAERALHHQLSYASRYTLLSRLMHKFHDALTRDPTRVDRLKKAFSELEGIFQEVKEFKEFAHGLSQQFGELLEGMSYRLDVDFSAYDPSRFFHSLRVVAKEDNQRRTFEELGTGQEQLLALAFAHAYACAFYGGIVLVIEEPEAHLHPLAQRWLARKIREMCKQGLQVVITTHSPAFVDIEGLDGLVLVRKEADGATVVRQLDRQMLVDHCVAHGACPDKAKPNSILPFYAAHATEEIRSGFFARAIVLVEGATEALALPVYLNRVGLDVTREGIAVIPVMGKGNLAKWWRLFTAYKIPVYVVFDNDAGDDSSCGYRRDVLGALGAKQEEAEQAVSTHEMLVQAKYCVFGLDFEECLRGLFSEPYRRLEAEAKDLFGESKPLKARYVAERLNLTESPGGESKIRELAQALRTLVGRRWLGEADEIALDEDIPF